MSNYTIFYSWQSDLPNNTNRSFISKCITDAIKLLHKDVQFDLEISLDRDTKDIVGTPDIVDTIIEKINRCSLFICDISIINVDYIGRKAPNPNVMFELGYAVKTLGWDKVIAVFNLDYGDFNDIPFDLRARRPLTYSIDKGENKNPQENVTKILFQTIKQLHHEGKLENKLKNHVKSKIDNQIYIFLQNVSRLICGYPQFNGLIISQDSIKEILKISYTQILSTIRNSRFIGFQIFQIVQERGLDVETFIKDPFNFQELNRNAVTAIVSLIRYAEAINNYNSRCFIPTTEYNGFYTYQKGVPKSNSANLSPRKGTGYFLGITTENGKFAVQDYGHFDALSDEEDLLQYYEIKPEVIESYAKCLFDYIQSVKLWVENTGNELITESAILEFHKLKV